MTEREKKMAWRFVAAASKVHSDRLPGWEAFLANDAKASQFMKEKESRVLGAFNDEDEVRFETALVAWVKACERICERLAEAYRKENADPELWELRYIKWMKITYIHFTSERGDFYLLPRKPRKKPRTEHWYTVDEMLDMLHPTVAAAIKLSDTMPIRPENVPKPGPGEKHLVCDFTKVPHDIYYDFIGAAKRG